VCVCLVMASSRDIIKQALLGSFGQWKSGVKPTNDGSTSFDQRIYHEIQNIKTTYASLLDCSLGPFLK
jgi:hypothetical protein